MTGHALIRTAISHGAAVADEVADRIASGRASGNGDLLDLCIVGAGPAGLAVSLQANSRGLKSLVLEQESPGGTVAKYPRRKLVMTQPVDLPAYGRVKRTSYRKEELIELWEDLARRYELPIQCGVEFRGLARTAEAHFLVRTNRGEHRARFICLALGRRGTPRKLGVPGEELPKVIYSLIDAQSYQGRRILVVGGGDSAVEAALGLAAQPGNSVTLSYRKSAFFRLKARNEARLAEALQANRLDCIFQSEVTHITAEEAHLRIEGNGEGPVERVLANDNVFVMAGEVPPLKLLEESGVSFDPAKRAAPPPPAERGTGLLKALAGALGLSLVTLAWVLVFREYYSLPEIHRPESPLHPVLRPSGPLGLMFGTAAAVLIVGNLGYLVRRASLGRWIPGSLRAWMTSHVLTGILSLLLVLVHGAMAPENTVSGHACWALVVLLITGVVGRYFYSFVPRAASGKELELEELQARLASESQDWDQYGREFGESVRREIHALVTTGKWKQDFLQRVLALFRTQRGAREILLRLRRQGRRQGLSKDELDNLIAVAKRAYRTALVSAHQEDLRALLASWRFFHRWVALLMVLLAAAHIMTALRFARLVSG
ncbi:MAG: NAD(P)-binding domain-containing protein [Planctomycetota bacterium]